MTTPAREQESQQATEAYLIALAALGAASTDDAVELWQNVPIEQTGKTVGAWLKQAMHLISTRRRVSRELALAYYRLVRALQTGRTIANPLRPDPPYVTMAQLRFEFARLVGPQEPPVGAPDKSEKREDDGELVPVDKLTDFGRPALERLERSAETEVEIVLVALGPDRLDKYLAEIEAKDDGPSTETRSQSKRDKARKKVKKRAKRREAHAKAGELQARAAARIVKNGGRDTTWDLMSKDGLAKGWIRISKTGTPCPWCAMLISRGAVYKTEASATAKGARARSVKAGRFAEGGQFHDDCNCIAVQVWVPEGEDIPEGKLYKQNIYFAELWQKVTKGHSGKEAVAVWRRYIHDLRTTRAPEARSTRNVQEA